MKKASIGNRKPLKRASGTPKTIDEYLLRIPEPARRTLKKVRAAIRSVVPPEATETISYRIPAFRYNGVLVWFAAFSGHWSLFPTSAVFEKRSLLNDVAHASISSFKRFASCSSQSAAARGEGTPRGPQPPINASSCLRSG